MWFSLGCRWSVVIDLAGGLEVFLIAGGLEVFLIAGGLVVAVSKVVFLVAGYLWFSFLQEVWWFLYVGGCLVIGGQVVSVKLMVNGFSVLRRPGGFLCSRQSEGFPC